MTQSHQPDHFERLYQANPDPWSYRSSPYEQAKYQHTIDALEQRRFASGLEVGCSIGELTRRLADRCDSLLGLDVVDAALHRARSRCADAPWVRFANMQVPQAWPEGRFDLIVLSEVLYFLCDDDLQRLARRVRDTLQPDGLVLIVNWLGHGDDPLSGDAAAEGFIHASADVLVPTRQDRRPGYRLDRLELRQVGR